MSARKKGKTPKRKKPTPPSPPSGAPRSQPAPRLSREQIVDNLILAGRSSSTLARFLMQLDAQGIQDPSDLIREALVKAAAVSIGAPYPPAQPAKEPPRAGLPPVTDRQFELLRFINERVQATGIYPSHREIAERFGMVQRHVAMYLRPLADRGYLRHAKRGAWELTDEAARALSTPGA